MKRVTLVLASLLAAVGCASPTAPRDAAAAKAARAANAKAQLDAVSHGTNVPHRIAMN